MQQLADFVKDKNTKIVLSKNPEYYFQIKKDRDTSQQIKELNNRIDHLEQTVAKLTNLIRERLNGR